MVTAPPQAFMFIGVLSVCVSLVERTPLNVTSGLEKWNRLILHLLELLPVSLELSGLLDPDNAH